MGSDPPPPCRAPGLLSGLLWHSSSSHIIAVFAYRNYKIASLPFSFAPLARDLFPILFTLGPLAFGIRLDTASGALRHHALSFAPPDFAPPDGGPDGASGDRDATRAALLAIGPRALFTGMALFAW